MKRIIIIGGGIAGLSAGIHAQLYGFESIIYEKHSIVGGQCTGWDRKGYHIDGCIHWLTGTNESTDINHLWKTVGALQDVEIIQLDNFGTYHFGETTLTLWRDLDRLYKEWTELSPEDTEAIKEFIRDIKAVQSMEMPVNVPTNMMSPRELFKLIRAMKGAGGVLNKAGKISCEEYSKRFRHPALQKLFSFCMPEGFSIAAFIFSMGTFTSGNGAIPRGGSRAMALRMEKRYKELGGRVELNTAIDEIVIKDGQAEGVLLSSGKLEKADYVVATSDVKHTFEKLLRGKYKDKKFEMRFQNPETYKLPTSIQIGFGVTADLKDYPVLQSFVTEPFEIAGRIIEGIGVKHYAYEPSFAPEGCTVMTSSITQSDRDYLYWKQLSRNKDEYKKEKQRIGKLLLERLEKHMPELAGKITILDVATPMTYHRYMNAYHGAWMSFMMTTDSKMMDHSGKIKGLENVLLAGQWLQPPGGLPVALTTGKFAILRICKREKCLKHALERSKII